MNNKFKSFGLNLVALIGLTLSLSTHALEIKTWKTDNGVTVLFVESHALPIVDVRLNFKAGSSRDGDKPGISRLVNALLVDGTGELTAEEIALTFESVGAELGHDSLRDMAWTRLRSLSDKSSLDSVVDLFARVTALPSFPQNSLERDRKSMLISLQNREKDIASVAEDAFYRTLYANHAYRIGSHGTAESLNKIDHKTLEQFHQKYYVGKNAVMAIVGDLTTEQAKSYASQMTRYLPAGESAGELAKPESIKKAEIFIPFKTTQTHIYQGFPVLARKDPDYFKLYLGNHILGGSGFGSRLMQEIREKRGLSYSVYSYFIPMETQGPFEVSLQTKNHQVEEAIMVMQDTLQDFINNGPSEEELVDAKLNITGSFALKTDSNKKIVEYLALIGFYDLPLDYLDSFNENINQVTLQQIKQAFKNRLKLDQMIRVIVGAKS